MHRPDRQPVEVHGFVEVAGFLVESADVVEQFDVVWIDTKARVEEAELIRPIVAASVGLGGRDQNRGQQQTMEPKKHQVVRSLQLLADPLDAETDQEAVANAGQVKDPLGDDEAGGEEEVGGRQERRRQQRNYL